MPKIEFSIVLVLAVLFVFSDTFPRESQLVVLDGNSTSVANANRSSKQFFCKVVFFPLLSIKLENYYSPVLLWVWFGAIP